MGLRITKDVLYYAENNEWKPLPVIKGEPGSQGPQGETGETGKDAYEVWLEVNNLPPDPEHTIYWERYLQEVSRAPVPGASRVVKENGKYIAYTPKRVNSGSEPPALNTEFVPWDPSNPNSFDRYELPDGGSGSASGISYKALTTADTTLRPILFGAENPTAGSLISEIAYVKSPSTAVSDVGYNPTYFVFAAGNRSSVSNTQRVGSAQSPQLRLCTNIGSVASLPNAYKGQHDVNVALIGSNNGNLYIGGTTGAHAYKDYSDHYCPRGSTIINAGLASLYGTRYDMTNGSTASAPNAVMILRGKDGTTGAWSFYNNVDSGHVEHIRVPFKPAPTTALTYGQRYYPGTSNQVYSTTAIESLYLNNLNATWNSKATDNSHSYDVIIQTDNRFTNPYIQYSVLGEEMAYITPFADYFNIWGVRYDSSRGQLHFSISCKKSKNIGRYPTYTTEHPAYVYIDFMLFTKDYKDYR